MKLPRDLSGQRVVRALKRLGFIEERREGSHTRLVRGSLRVTVPAHHALAPKTLQSILRQAQISVERTQGCSLINLPHRNFLHPKGMKTTLSGAPGDDAKYYQERDLKRAIQKVQS